MKYSALAEFFERIEATSKRLEMYDILAEIFCKAAASDMKPIVYMSQGRLGPAFDGMEVGMSDKLLVRTLSDVSGRPTAAVQEIFEDTGDIGITAARLCEGSEGLSVAEVFAELHKIAAASGKGSQDQKINMLASLLRAASPLEARYIARFVIGKLRLGVGDPSVIEALAISAEDRAHKAEIERAYNLCSDLGLVAESLKQGGMEAIRSFGIRVGYPVRVALCERVPTSADVIAKMGRAAIEAKYDGIRCQVHMGEGVMEIFSRNQERMGHMFPEIVSAARALPAKSLIMEGEALAFNEDTGELLPFQVTMQRKRKHNVSGMAAEFPLKFFAFELLYLDGRDLTGLSYRERRAELIRLIESAPAAGTIEPAVMFETDDPAEIDRHFGEFVETGLEGVVAKRLDSPYAAGSRNFNWIKLKRSYRGELADTVDVCIVGYYKGKGSRARFGVGALLGAVYEPATDTFKTVTRIGSGFTEAELAEVKLRLDEVAAKIKPSRVESLVEPDVWVEPRFVITLTADEITRSPSHTAGRDESGAGYALRFPRTTGFLRDDKAAEDATTVAEVIKLFEMQKRVQTA